MSDKATKSCDVCQHDLIYTLARLFEANMWWCPYCGAIYEDDALVSKTILWDKHQDAMGRSK